MVSFCVTKPQSMSSSLHRPSNFVSHMALHRPSNFVSQFINKYTYVDLFVELLHQSHNWVFSSSTLSISNNIRGNYRSHITSSIFTHSATTAESVPRIPCQNRLPVNALSFRWVQNYRFLTLNPFVEWHDQFQSWVFSSSISNEIMGALDRSHHFWNLHFLFFRCLKSAENLLLKLPACQCTFHSDELRNTFFTLKPIHGMTWINPRFGYSHLPFSR